MEDRSRNRKRARARKRRQRNLAMKVFLFIIIIVGVIGGAFLLKKYGPTKEKADLNEYYGIQKENQLAVIVDNEVLGASGIMLDGKPYVEYSVVRDYLSGRFIVHITGRNHKGRCGKHGVYASKRENECRIHTS